MRRMRPLLGTFVEVGLRDADVPQAIEAAFAAIELAQARWSFHDRTSELSHLNNTLGTRVPLSQATLQLLRLALALMRASGGAFDCTIGGTLVAAGVLPDHGGPAPLPGGTPADVELGSGWARLRRPVRLTLDGIAKGQAVDLAIHAMRGAGAAAGWVNAGGDMRAFGDLALPVSLREADGSHRPLGRLRDAAMATSAVAGRAGGESAAFPGHIIGKTGQPPRPGTFTVLARRAWRADALTKVAACTPAGRRAQTVARLGGHLVEAAE